MRTKIFAVATAALLAFSIPAHAETAANDEVSDAVDIALWCGAAYTVAANVPDVTAEDAASSNEMANLAFARAKLALDADGIAETEYTRLVNFYVDAAMTDMTTEVEMRYSDEECAAEATAE